VRPPPTWYEVLQEISRARPQWDLATGQPLRDARIGEVVASALAAAAAAAGTPDRLAAYVDLDGAPEFRSAFAAMLGAALGRPVDGSELLVVPGAQSALRGVHAAMRAARRRLLFPAGLDYPGSVDGRSPWAPSAGRPRWSAGRTVIDLDPAGLDWDQVGAVILSQPHSPTGRVWPAAQLQDLAGQAARRGAWLVLDETFGLPAMPLQIDPVRLADGPAVVHVFSFSKAGLAAERLGVVAGPPPVIEVLRAELRATAIAASYLGQLLAAALLTARPAPGAGLGQLYRSRWQTLHGALGQALDGAGVAAARWQGGPFMWLSWERGPDDMTVFRELLRRGVGVTPGTVLHAAGEPVRGIRIGLGAPACALGHAGAVIQQGLLAAGAA
jgi:DNA-binding transcriptional MocR family regulator